MSLMWVDVVDTTIKIGFGSIVTAFYGYFSLKKSHDNESYKEEKSRLYELQNIRKYKYVEFMSKAQLLVQTYMYTNCSCDTEDYTSYLSVYSEILIISDREVSLAASSYHQAVNQFISHDHAGTSSESKKLYRNNVNDTHGAFISIVNQDINQIYNKNNK